MCTCGYTGLGDKLDLSYDHQTRWLLAIPQDVGNLYRGVNQRFAHGTRSLICTSCLRPRSSAPCGGGTIVGYDVSVAFDFVLGKNYAVSVLVTDVVSPSCMTALVVNVTGRHFFPITLRAAVTFPEGGVLVGEEVTSTEEPVGGLASQLVYSLAIPLSVLPEGPSALYMVDHCLERTTKIVSDLSLGNG
jgi:hypothetical protein